MHILVLHQAGMGLAVGVNQTIHAEVAIMLGFAVITAVPVHRLAIGSFTLIDGVIAPLPHKAAAELLMGIEHLEVILQVSGAVAHGVAVFTQDHGLIGVALQIGIHLLQRGVHAAEQVDVGVVVLALAALVVGTLVVGQAGGIELLRPLQGFLKGDTVGALITHGPDQNAGTVLVAVDQAAGTVQRRLDEIGVIGNRFVPALELILIAAVSVVDQHRAVALVVSFVDDVEAVQVAELVEDGGIGIVAGADRVEVVLFHHLHVRLHLFDADGVAGDGIGIVAVHAAELDGLAVEIHHAVADGDLADTHPVGDNLIGGFQHHRVEVRIFRIPQVGFIQMNLHSLGVNMIPGGRCRAGPDGRIFRIAEGDSHRQPFHCRLHLDLHIRAVILQGGGDGVVGYMLHRALEEVHITEDTAHAELVLILQVAAVAPLEHQHRQLVGAVLEVLGDVELAGAVGHLTVTHVPAIQPDVEAGVNTFEVQEGFGSAGVYLVVKLPDVGAAGILLGHIGWVKGEGIFNIGVLMLIIAMHLPNAGNRDLIVVVQARIGFVKAVLQIVDAAVVAEIPKSAEQLESI